MSKKKKQGSALVVVLLFSLFFVVISGISALAVVSTLKGNTGEAVNQTLYYEAEGGIARANAKATKGNFDTLADEATTTFDYHEASTNDHVFVKVKYTGDKNAAGAYTIRYLQVESTAVENGISTDNPSTTTKPKRVAKGKLKPNIANSDVFKYSICGNSVNAVASGSFAGNTTGINSATNPAITEAPSMTPPVEKNELFSLPEFDNNKIKKHVGVLQINTVGDLKSTLDALLSSPSIADSSVKRLKLDPTTGTPGKFYVYMINADKIQINVPRSVLSDMNIMILTNGDINIVGNGIGSALNLTASILVGNSINIQNGASITFYYSPAPNVNTYEGHSPLSQMDIKKIFESTESNNQGITYYAPNLKYDSGGTPPPGSSTNGKYGGYDFE